MLEKLSVSVGKYLTPSLSFALAVRDKSVRITRERYTRRLEWISNKFFVFWDEGEKRAWLVNGPSALLHIVRASLAHNRQSKFKSSYTFNSGNVIEAQVIHEPGSALAVLLNMENRKLKFSRDYQQDYTDEDGNSERQSKDKESGEKMHCLFQDRVEEIFEMLEKLIDYKVCAKEENGLDIHFRARKSFEGWDFKDLVTENDPFQPRLATLSALNFGGKGWIDFIKSIHAVTLLGKGFGDIIRPTAESNTCHFWSTLPKGKDYLAASLQDLKDIANLHGDPSMDPMRLSESIYWHNPAPDLCHCRGTTRKNLQKGHRIAEHSEFAQTLRSTRPSKKRSHRASPFNTFVFRYNIHPLETGLSRRTTSSAPSQARQFVDYTPDVQDFGHVGPGTPASTFTPNASETPDQPREHTSNEYPAESSQQAHYATDVTGRAEDDGHSPLPKFTKAGLTHRLYARDSSPSVYESDQRSINHEQIDLTSSSAYPGARDDVESPKKIIEQWDIDRNSS